MGLPTLDRDDRQELRCAVVMTGGVSLAVWMGGVTLEIHRLAKGDGPWGDLLDLMGSTAIVDIISGTSAGGLNGALLAAATTSDLEVATVARLRDTWLEMGSLSSLLRDADETSPPSLLKGDEYFLPEIAIVLRDWLAPGCVDAGVGHDPAQDRELVLLLTASLLDGEPRVHRDDVGSLLSETEHLARFRFDEAELRRPGVENRLAVAARTSASFPGAFEASYLAVSPVEGRVSLNGNIDLGSNRWAVDGGILMNQPIEPALEAMYAQPARNETRRVLLAVEPDPGAPVRPVAADPTKPPSMRDVIGASMLTLPRQQSIARELATLRATNERVRKQQRVRRELVRESARRPGTLAELAARLYPVFVARRTDDAATRTSARIAARAARLAIDPNFDWRAAERELEAAAIRSSWLPPADPDDERLPATDLEAWPWGISSLEYAVSTVGDLLKSVQQAMSLSAARSARGRRAELRSVRELLNRIRRDLGVLRVLSDDYWQLRILGRVGETDATLGRWADASFARWPRVGDAELDRLVGAEDVLVERWRRSLAAAAALTRRSAHELDGAAARTHLGYLASWLATLVTNIAPTLHDVLDHATIGRRDDLRDLISVLAPEPDTPAEAAITHVVDTVIALFVVQVAVDSGTRAREQMAELVQVSAEAASPLDPTRVDPDTKLAGAQVAHFGAFYKRSWRANDWTWGRLDGSARLVRVVLEPQRLAQRVSHLPASERRAAALDAIEAVMVPQSGRSRAVLTDHWLEDRAAVAAELAWLDADEPELPGSLPRAVHAVTRRFHHEILHDELPRLADEVAASHREGAAVSAAAAAFRDAVLRVRRADGEVPGAHLHDLFDAWRIGEERLNDETDTPLFVSTITRIAAVATAAAQGARSGLGLLRLPLIPLRWLLRTVDRVVGWWRRLRR